MAKENVENPIKRSSVSVDRLSNENLMVKFESVSKLYKDNSLALENINLEIREGEFISIVGPSGAGKSTLLKLIYAEEMPTEGNVYFNGRPLNTISKRKMPFHRRVIGTVFQDSKLLHKKTVFENVAYALEVLGAPAEEIQEDVPQILEIVGLGNMMEKFPQQLSGGEKQKVAMARALIHKPIIIIADEPTGNLDPVSSVEIVDLLLKINELGTTVLLASHDKDIVNKAQKRVLVMDKGKILSDYAKGKYKFI
jgi:cell division transport system ATP-binding protein